MGGVTGEVARKDSKKGPPSRRYVFCPVEGCGAPPLKKMPQHLRQYHKLAEAEVLRLSNMPCYRRSESGVGNQHNLSTLWSYSECITTFMKST